MASTPPPEAKKTTILDKRAKMQDDIISKMVNGVNKTLSKFCGKEEDDKSSKNSNTEDIFNFISAANQFKKAHLDEDQAEKLEGTLQHSAYNKSQSVVALDLKKEKIAIYKQLLKKQGKDLLMNDHTFFSKISTDKDELNQRRVKHRKDEIQKLWSQITKGREMMKKTKDQSKTGLQPMQFEDFIVRIIPYDPKSKGEALQLFERRQAFFEKHSKRKNKVKMFKSQIDIKMRNPLNLSKPPSSNVEAYRLFKRKASLFTLEDLREFLKKNWAVPESKDIKLRACMIEKNFIFHEVLQMSAERRLLKLHRPDSFFAHVVSQQPKLYEYLNEEMLVDVFSNEELPQINLHDLANKSQITEDLTLTSDAPPSQDPKKVVVIMYQFGKKKQSPAKSEKLDETLSDEEREEQASFESLSSTNLSEKDSGEDHPESEKILEDSSSSDESSFMVDLDEEEQAYDKPRKARQLLAAQAKQKVLEAKREELVGMIINILQILTLKQGQRSVSAKIEGGAEQPSEEEDSEIFEDQQEIERLKDLLFDKQKNEDPIEEPPILPEDEYTQQAPITFDYGHPVREESSFFYNRANNPYYRNIKQSSLLNFPMSEIDLKDPHSWRPSPRPSPAKPPRASLPPQPIPARNILPMQGPPKNPQPPKKVKKIVPKVLSPEADLGMKTCSGNFAHPQTAFFKPEQQWKDVETPPERKSLDRRVSNPGQLRNEKKSTKTYSFCEKGSLRNAENQTINEDGQRPSEKVSSIYAISQVNKKREEGEAPEKQSNIPPHAAQMLESMDQLIQSNTEIKSPFKASKMLRDDSSAPQQQPSSSNFKSFQHYFESKNVTKTDPQLAQQFPVSPEKPHPFLVGGNDHHQHQLFGNQHEPSPLMVEDLDSQKPLDENHSLIFQPHSQALKPGERPIERKPSMSQFEDHPPSGVIDQVSDFFPKKNDGLSYPTSPHQNNFLDFIHDEDEVMDHSLLQDPYFQPEPLDPLGGPLEQAIHNIQMRTYHQQQYNYHQLSHSNTKRARVAHDAVPRGERLINKFNSRPDDLTQEDMGFKQIESNLQKMNERERYQPSVSDNVSDIPHYDHMPGGHLSGHASQLGHHFEAYPPLNKRQAKQVQKEAVGQYLAVGNFNSPVKRQYHKLVSSAQKGDPVLNKRAAAAPPQSKKPEPAKPKPKKKEPFTIPHPDSVFDMKAIEEEIALEKQNTLTQQLFKR